MMCVDEALADLCLSIETARLVILCGAGLSIASPSCVPLAAELARECYERHRATTGERLPIPEWDLGAQASWFYNRARLVDYFIGRLIPTDIFSVPSNQGHAAIADFLLCKAIAAGISTNVDMLIEKAADSYGGHIEGALDGDQAQMAPMDRSPLLKLHGCWNQGKRETVWTSHQLDADPLRARVERSRIWLEAELRDKDLLVVGFWSDWSYLNEVVGCALGAALPASVTLVDPGAPQDLQQKAPQLWDLAHRPNVSFRHVPASGDSFLDALRVAFSKGFFRKVVSTGAKVFSEVRNQAPDDAWLEAPDLSSEEWYCLRRDLEGVPPTRHAREREPRDGGEAVGLAILLLRAAGAVWTGAFWQINGYTVRVINAQARLLHRVRDEFGKLSAPLASPRLTICVGAEDLGLTADVVRPDTSATVARAAPEGDWLTLSQAQEKLGP